MAEMHSEMYYETYRLVAAYLAYVDLTLDAPRRAPQIAT